MTEAAPRNPPFHPESRATGSTIRRQLIWASLFPLAAFGLLAILLITAALSSLTQTQSQQRDSALAQVAASRVADRLSQVVLPLQDAARDPNFGAHPPAFERLSAALAPLHADLIQLDARGRVVGASPAAASWIGKTLAPPQGSSKLWVSPTSPAGSPAVLVGAAILQGGQPQGWLVAIQPYGDAAWLSGMKLPLAAGSRLTLFDRSGTAIAHSGPPEEGPRGWLFTGEAQPQSVMIESPVSGDQAIYSYAPVPGTSWGIALEEPWQALFSSAASYAWALAGLLTLGFVLSILMLSVSLGRVIRPLSALARLAESLGPGSTFRPIPEEGPEELRSLTYAFNQMVIRLAEQQTTLRQYAEKALLSQEEERQRISHELHDETVQELVGLLQRVDLCRTEMENSPELARRRLDELKQLAEQALNDLRRISNALRPSILQDLGLPAAIQTLCDEMERQMPELACEFTLEGLERRLAPDLELAIFRVAQEALTNIRRHSGQVSQVSVSLGFEPDRVYATIQDDGPGFPSPDVRQLVRDGHLGVAGMYERARLFGGELSIGSDPQAGTTIRLSMPVEMGITLDPTENGGNYA